MEQDFNKETSAFLSPKIPYKYLLLSLHKCIGKPQHLWLCLRVRVFYPANERQEFMFSPFLKRLIGLIFLAPFQTGCYRYIATG